MTKHKPKPGTKKVGRPELIAGNVVTKLEQAFAIDATISEACSYAGVSRKVFYEYMKRHPEFGDRIADLREKPVLKARMTVVNSLEQPEHAKWYLERKRKKEFTAKSEIDLKGEVDTTTTIKIIKPK